MKFINDHLGAIAIVLTVALVAVAYFTVKNTQALNARSATATPHPVPPTPPAAPVASAATAAEEK